MAEFKKHVQELLPYDRTEYRFHAGWYGVSFQLDPVLKEINITNFIEMYGPFFKDIINQLHNGAHWVVSHDDKDMEWFPNDADNLPALRTLFRQSHTPGAFKGALVFNAGQILQYATDIISYPYAAAGREGFLYKDVAITNSLSGFVIKISGHLNIDLLSTDMELLKEMAGANASPDFIIKLYSGTSW